MIEQTDFDPTSPPDVVYEDNHLLVVNKPTGVLVQGDHTQDATLLDQCKAYLKVKYAKPGKVFLGLVHRLDRPAAGLIVLARTSKAASRLSEQFRKRTVDKGYLAVVEGRIKAYEGELKHNLFWDDQLLRSVVQDSPGAKEAHLRWKCCSIGQKTSLIEVELITGRKHQIRAQMACIGHPVAGDGRYGARGKPLIQGIALLAWHLAIEHPTLKKHLCFDLPVPDGWPW